MNVQTRILLLLLLLVAVFVGGLAAARIYQQKHLREVITARATKKAALFDQFLEHQGESLEVWLGEVSQWKQTAEALQEHNTGWASQKLELDQLALYDANVLWLYTGDGALFYSTNNLYLETLKDVPASADDLRRTLAQREKIHCFAPTDAGWLEIRGAPVQARGAEGPSPGFVFVGRLWSAPFLSEISMLTDSEVNILPPREAGTLREGVSDDGIFHFKRPLRDWRGEPAAYLAIRTNSVGIPELNRALAVLSAGIVIFSGVMLAMLGLALWYWVSRPLRLISESLNRNDLSHINRLRTKRTEFGRLAELIHHFFHQREILVRETRERLHTEAALTRSEEQLRHSQKMEAVGRLAGGVAHDFNNLLTGIIGYADILTTRLKGRDGLHAAAISEGGQRAATLTQQLLAFSRKQMLQPRVLDLNQLIINLAKLLRRVIGEHITLQLNLASGPTRICADPGQMEQVIMNLCVNARDAMPAGGTVTIGTATSTEEGSPREFVELCVIDGGCGIDDELQQKIFEPFFTTKPAGKGTGLGLSTVYGIISQSGGVIDVESAPGRGATFRIRLPATGEELPPPPAAASRAPSAKTGETILLVEDEEFVRHLITDVLTDQGYRVIAAVDGLDGLGKLPRTGRRVDLLLSDVVMPKMNGFELAKAVVSEQPAIKVLFMSGYADSEMADYGIEAMTVSFLAKPFSPTDLLKCVRSTLDTARQEERDLPDPALP